MKFFKQYYVIIFFIVCIIVYLLYKIKQNERFKALMRLCNLNQEELDAYFNSYKEIFSDNSMISTLDDFNNNKPPTRFAISKETKPSEYTADCYSILKDLCALGNVKKMYIPKTIDKKLGVIENQFLNEKEIANNLLVKPKQTLLEIGCGCGRISHYISTVTNCKVIGINIDETQLKDARNYAKEKKTDNEFIFQDVNDTLPFEDETFDAIYTIQGLITWINYHDKVFGELYRILKKGGRIVIIDAVLLDNFDKNNTHHLKLMSKAREVMAGGNFLHYKYIEDIVKKAGFNIIVSKGGDYPNEAAEFPLLLKEHKHYDKIKDFINISIKLKILPNYMNNLIDRLRYGIDDWIEMLENNLLTTIWEFILEKPIDNSSKK